MQARNCDNHRVLTKRCGVSGLQYRLFCVDMYEFGDTFERKAELDQVQRGVTYRFVYHGGSGVPENGSGEVYEMVDPRFNRAGSVTELKDGPSKTQWSMGGNENGWLFNDPRFTRIWSCLRSDKATLLSSILKHH